MKKALIYSAILFFTLFSITHAAGAMSRGFGGRILNVPALEIKTAESTMVCEMAGETFDIKPVGKSQIGPYLIPFTSSQKTLKPGAWILGTHNATLSTIATCTDGYVTITIQGYVVKIYGTSK